MAGPALAHLRIELEADSASLEDGLNKAGSALRKFGSQAAALGSLAADAIVAAVSRMAEAFGAVLNIESAFFQNMSAGSQRASLLIQQSFAGMQERATEFAQNLIDRVLPGIANVIDRLGDLPYASQIASFAMEVMVGAFKSLVTAGALVVAVIEGTLHIIGSAAQALLALATGQFAEAYAHIQRGAENVAGTIQGTFQTIRDIWAETEIAANRLGPAVLGPWTTIVQRSQTDVALMRQLREEMAALFADPTSTEEERIAAATAAHAAGAISVTKFEEAKRKAYLATQQVMENSFRAVGQALTAVFDKSKPAAIASALINTYVGITQALRSGPYPFNVISAAAVGAMGFAQVRNITSTSSTGGGGAASAPSPSAAADMGAPSQLITVEGLTPDSIMSGMSVRSLIERLNAAVKDGATLVIA